MQQVEKDLNSNVISVKRSAPKQNQQDQPQTRTKDQLQKNISKSLSPMKNLRLFQNSTASQIPTQKLSKIINPLQQYHQSIRSETKFQNPITYLLHHQSSKAQSVPSKRSNEEISLIWKLIESNKIWKDLGFEDLTDAKAKDRLIKQEMLRQISNSIVLLWSEVPNTTEIKPDEVYLILEGKTFEYIHNENTSIKLKIHENNDYLMIRKLVENDYFFSLPHLKPKMKSIQNPTEKYQLMVDEKTLMGKISDQLFRKWVSKKLVARVKQITTFFRKVSIFQNLPDSVFQQMSKFTKLKQTPSSTLIIGSEEKSKQVYFIKEGEIQLNFIPIELYSNKEKTPKKEILKQFDVFGMDTLHKLQKSQDSIKYSARSITKCELYSIDKRILAIVISSFENQLKAKNIIVKPVDINSQITGQNYFSIEQQFLNQNAIRIKTAQKKIRDVKLRSYSRKNNRIINTYIPEKERVKESKLQAHQNKFQSSSSVYFKTQNSKSIKSQSSLFNHKQSTDSLLWKIKTKLQQESPAKQQNQSKITLNHMVFPLIQQEPFNKKNHTLLSTTTLNDFQRIQKKSLNLFSSIPINRTTSYEKKKKQFYSTSSSLIPKVRTKSSIFQTVSNSGKIQSEIIKNFLQRKTKNEVARKIQEILEIKSNTKRNAIKNIKKFYKTDSFSPSKKTVCVVPIQSKTLKELTEELVERMANIKQYPLLFLIQNERKKMDSQLKRKQAPQKKAEARAQIEKNERKAKINDLNNLMIGPEQNKNQKSSQI